jgi:transcriptional regulator with XRE-family HTH domain
MDGRSLAERYYEALARNLREARVRSQMTQSAAVQALASIQVEFSRSGLANVERALQRPPVHVLAALAEIYAADLTDLLPSGDDGFGVAVRVPKILESAPQATKVVSDILAKIRSEAD